MTWPAVALWLLFGYGLVSRGPVLLYLLLITGIFGTLQMIPGGAASGVNLLPQSICAALFVLRVFLVPGNIVRGLEAALDPTRLGLFTPFVLFSLVSAVVLPRLFNGQIETVPVSAYVSGTTLLGPSSGNITQPAYLLISYGTALAVAILGDGRNFRRHLLGALLATGVALLVAGLLDLVTYNTGLSSLLDPFRTASYALLTDVEAVGSKRVVGFSPEASVFGTSCLNLLAALAFLRPLFPRFSRRVVVPLVIAGLFAMTVLSTSSGAMVGLAVLGVLYGCNLLIRSSGAFAPARDEIRWELVLLGVVALVLLAAVVIYPRLFDPIQELVDVMVFQKTASASFAERSMWTRVGLEAFVNTGGLGVGLGSIRTSNWFVSILSSTGLFGAVVMAMFLMRLFLVSRPTRSTVQIELTRAFRFTLVPMFTIYALGGAIPDIGILTAVLFGMLSLGPSRAAMVPLRVPRPGSADRAVATRP